MQPLQSLLLPEKGGKNVYLSSSNVHILTAEEGNTPDLCQPQIHYPWVYFCAVKNETLFYTVDGFHGLSLRGVKFCQIKNFRIDQLNYLAQAKLRLLLCRPNPFLGKPLEVCK